MQGLEGLSEFPCNRAFEAHAASGIAISLHLDTREAIVDPIPSMHRPYLIVSAWALGATAAALCALQACVASGSDGPVASPPEGAGFGAIARGPADASVQPACFGSTPPLRPFDPTTCPFVSDAAPVPCQGLACDVDMTCEGGTSTTVTGTLYDPAGRNPVANALAFVPLDPLGRLPAVASGTPACGKCPAFFPGSIVNVTLTDATGHFTITNVPSGVNIPIAFQVGKWRRVVFVPEVRSCVATVVPPELSRLPRNQDEGDIPQLALLTGGCDRLACFLTHVGIDASEFTGPDGNGRIHVYRGAGSSPDLSSGTAGDCTGDAGACPLWTTKERLANYDALLLGCECGENNQTKTDTLPLHDWLNEGGNVLAIHSQRAWFKNGPADFRGIASWNDGASSRPFDVDTTFVDGQIFHDWLVKVNLLGPDGNLPLNPAQVSTSVSTVSSDATSWIVGDRRSADSEGSASSRDVKAFSFLTPIGGKLSTPSFQAQRSYCGRAVFTDIHPGGGDVIDTSPVPASCGAAEMTAEETALEYLLFDMNNCLTPFLSNRQEPPTAVTP